MLEERSPTMRTVPSTHRKRYLIAALLLSIVILVTAAYFMAGRKQVKQQSNTQYPWFAPYIDATNMPMYPFEQPSAALHTMGILSFITASSSDPCTPTWGGYYTLDEAADTLRLDARIKSLRQQGGQIAVSFGGAAGNELATTCIDPKKLARAYQTVIDRYELTVIDLDLEGAGLTDTLAMQRRAVALNSLQTTTRDSKRQLAVWLTLPVTPTGLTNAGKDTITALLDQSVNIAGVNIMTMEYGESRPSSQSMYDAAIDALNSTHAQLLDIYRQAGNALSPTSAWSKIGVTPQIGQAADSNELFTLDDAKRLNAYSKARGIGRVSMWSANRDAPCGDAATASTGNCSGTDQPPGAYADALGNGFSVSKSQ